jgi:hypothetical protein
MSTANRTREQMSFQRHWNGNPCAYALIGDAVKPARPAVDPASCGEMVT